MKNFVRPSSSSSEKIIVKYGHDVNLIELSDRILKYIESDSQKKIPILEQRILELKSKLEKRLYHNERQSLMKEISILQENLTKLDVSRKKENFIKSTQDITEDYKQLGILPNSSAFDENPTITEDPEKATIRKGLIFKFLSISQGYASLEIERKQEVLSCPECFYSLENIASNQDERSEIICPKCNFILRVFVQVSTVHSDSNYDDRDNYLKAIYRFQGKEKVNFNCDLHKILDKLFQSRNIPTSEEIREMPLIDGRRGDLQVIGKRLLRKALAGVLDFSVIMIISISYLTNIGDGTFQTSLT